MNKIHSYTGKIIWTGNNGTGTSDYTTYQRNFDFLLANKITLACSADTPFRGDGSKHNPEDFLLGAIASCHMLWYLHLCADAQIIVTGYEDTPLGIMIQKPIGGGCFEKVTLKPVVTILNLDKKELAMQLHAKANECCFIANSLNFKVSHEPSILVA
jgi:organic hydroperoxide reductase OsmC/OhrA